MRAFFLFILVLLSPITLSASVFSESVLERREVKAAIRRFTGVERSFLQRGLKNASLYLPSVKDSVRKKNLPEELAYLPLIESAYSVRAFSRAGASGLWQFMAPTARFYNLRVDFWVDERRDPFKSTDRALRHIRDLYRYFNNWELALAAYNAGQGAVKSAVRRGNSRDYWELCTKHLLKRETMEYVPRFIAAAYIAKQPQTFGFVFDEDKAYPAFETLTLEKPIDLTVFCRRSGIHLEKLRFLNPELIRFLTPPDRSYNIRIPRDFVDRALTVYLNLPAEELTGVARYRIRCGETLSTIAERYGTTVTMLKLINNIRNPKKIYAGRMILVPLHGEKQDTVDIKPFIPIKDTDTQEIRYTVRRGDTLWEIARRYGSDIETLIAINGMGFNSILMPGEEIVLWIKTAFRR